MTYKLKDVDTGNIIDLETGDVLGRSQGKHTFPETKQVSRTHCKFIVENDLPYLMDLGSRNGTFIDSCRCEPQKKILLLSGQILKMGEKIFSFESEGRSTSETSIVLPISIRKKPLADKLNFQFKADTWEMVKLIIYNTIFTILTFGLYFIYARRNMRQFVWKSTYLQKTPFLFKGESKGLWKSYLMLVGLTLLLTITKNLTAVLTTNLFLQQMFNLLYFAGLTLLLLKARFGAYSYLVNNTSYRSVFFGMNKKASGEHFQESIRGSVITLLSLGLYIPFSYSRLESIKWNNTQYGSLPLSYHPDHRKFAFLYYKGIILTALTAGLYFPWFTVSLHRYKMEHLRFGPAKFETSATGAGLLMVQLKSIIIMIITLGLAMPYVFNLNLTYFFNTLTIKGSIDFDQVIQASKSKQGSFDDAVAGMFDLDLEVG